MNFKSALIVTYGRSGSTLLQGILNSIEGCLIRGENDNFCFPLFAAYLSIVKARKMNGWRPETSFYGSNFLDEHFFIKIQRKLVRRLILGDCYYDESIECFGFKEIRYDHWHIPENFNEYLYFLEELFPETAIIFNTRNHEATAKSKWWADYDPKIVKEKLIKTEARFFEYMKENPQNTYHIAYEDVISKNEKLKGLFKFLGAEYDDERIDRTLRIKHSNWK